MAGGDLRWWSTFDNDGCKIWTRGWWGDDGKRRSWWEKERRCSEVREIEREGERREEDDGGWVGGQGRRWWWGNGWWTWSMVEGRELCLMREREVVSGGDGGDGGSWWHSYSKVGGQKRRRFSLFVFCFLHSYSTRPHVMFWCGCQMCVCHLRWFPCKFPIILDKFNTGVTTCTC